VNGYPTYFYQSLKKIALQVKLFSESRVSEPAAAETHNTGHFITPLSTVTSPLGSFSNKANLSFNQSFSSTASQNATDNMAVPTLALAATLLAWGVRRFTKSTAFRG